jgi:hypothetical protein
MLNHSWDVHIWYNMRNLKKKFGFHMFAHWCGYNKSIENLLFKWKNVEYNVILKIFWNGYSEANSIMTCYSSWEMFITIWFNLVSIDNQLWVLVSNLCIKYHVLNRI